MSEPLAYLLTWTTYGTWLPGDERGWVEKNKPGIQSADPNRHGEACQLLKEAPVFLRPVHRRIVEDTVVKHCAFRGWHLHAVNARSNHVHVVVTAPGTKPEAIMVQLKAWCSRRLNEYAGHEGSQKKWWTQHGSQKWINDVAYLQNATRYVEDGQ